MTTIKVFQVEKYKWQVLLFCFIILCKSLTQGYQYKTFIGPVSGAIKEVIVPYYSANHPLSYLKSRDYVAKPDYSFAYGVDDAASGNTQNHRETREGDVVKGEYSVVEPDGSLRIVSYTSDPKNGFQATINYKPPVYSPSSPSTSSGSSGSNSYDYY
ncbi:cuticle protein 8-like [Lycorma delicatula]|uniref:cuticle protein 8-like n=1 Tax=Lycorma delicatula TaxID=130591 RepID=UPI003F50F9A1